MGYFADHIKGSAFQKLRRKIVAGGLLYTITVGALFILFAPGLKRFSKELGEGGKYEDPQWVKDRNELLRLGLTHNSQSIEQIVKEFENVDGEKGPSSVS